MKILISTLCISILFLSGCNFDEKQNVTPKAPSSSKKFWEESTETKGSKDGESWEKKELEKYGLSKDSSVKDIIENKDKPKLDDIISWDK